MFTARRLHLLLAIVAATMLTAVALALSAGHSRASFLTPLSPGAPVASRAPFPAWAHGGATARAAHRVPETGMQQATAPSAARGNGPADSRHDVARTADVTTLRGEAQPDSALPLPGLAARIPTPPPRARVA